MPPVIENRTNCEICSVINFLSAKGLKVAGIHCEIMDVYGENIIVLQNGTEMDKTRGHMNIYDME